nr:reverse transcriptase domain-containing protein [Tanacetum cinerariifolium]
MLLVTQIDTFYNGLALSHRDTINAAAGGTFMQKTPEECYELIENMTAHHNHWDTSAIQDETSRNISSTSTTETPKVVRQLEMMNKNFSEMMRQFQTVKVVDTKCETCGGPHSLPSAQPSVATLKILLMLLWSGVTLAGPSVPPLSKEVDRKPETITDQELTRSTNNVPPLVVQPSPASTSFSIISSSKMPEVTQDMVQLKFDECLALVDLGASINLMPLSIWKKLSLPELTSTHMILELADQSTTRPAGIAEDVFVKVGKFYFPTNFVVVDYVVDPRVTLILRRPFLRTRRALLDVYGEEFTLRIDDKAITFKVGQTSKYSYNDAEGGDFILEEIDACLTSESIPPRIDDIDLDLEGDIRLLEELLNNDPSLSPLPSKEVNVEEIKTVKSSIDDPPELELKELASHFEYAF